MDSVPDDYLNMIIKKGGAYMGKMRIFGLEHKFNDEQVVSPRTISARSLERRKRNRDKKDQPVERPGYAGTS
jgi:hypothetical protein